MINPLKPNLYCKICSECFKSERSLHSHFKKHKLTLAEYYCQEYPRINKFSGDPLPFKNKFDYFTKDFTTRAQMNKWIDKSPADEVKEYILNQLRYRIQNKNLRFAPFHLEIETLKLSSSMDRLINRLNSGHAYYKDQIATYDKNNNIKDVILSDLEKLKN